MSAAPHNPNAVNPATLISYGLFIVFLIALSAFYLFVDFRGLTSKHGIDQAQIAREMVRGNGLTTKFLRPFSLYQANEQADLIGGSVQIDNFQDTYHAPLGIIANHIPLRMFKGTLELDKENVIYPADRVIAGTSMVYLMLSILVFYMLGSRIFDRKIGLVIVFLMIFCDLLWRFTHTGLPTMLMLLLFGLALYFLYRAIENQVLGLSPLGWAVLSSAMFGLLALTHWITIWIFIGALAFAALALRPRGMAAAIMGLVFLLVISPGLIRNFIVSGSIHGDAFYAIYNGLADLGESGTMRNFRPDSETLDLRGFAGRIAITSLDQFKQIIPYFGAILAAPMFFISLLHAFKRPEISLFRWGILGMWICAVVGMSIFGLQEGERDPNQIHILFAPIMAAYGLAMIAVLWNRLGVTANAPVLQNLPYIILVFLSAVPLLATMPRTLFRPGVFQDMPNYPPYLPQAIVYLNTWTSEREVIVSDMPWGTAWYADRTSSWLPRDMGQFDDMVEFFEAHRHPVAGIYFTPITTNARLSSQLVSPGSEFGDWGYWVLRPQFERSVRRTPRREDAFRFGVFMPMGLEMGFWSNFNRMEEGAPDLPEAIEDSILPDFGSDEN